MGISSHPGEFIVFVTGKYDSGKRSGVDVTSSDFCWLLPPLGNSWIIVIMLLYIYIWP